MHLTCPHCQNPIEVVEPATPEEVVCPSCGSSFHLEQGATTQQLDSSKKTLGRFLLLDAVGMGAFGTVYKARDPELDRVVAIKVPRAGNLAGAADRDRFLREARSVAQLRHAGIVSVHEVGQADGNPFLVSEFLQGVTLADKLTAHRLSFKESAELIAELADALQYAHSQGVVHRDVKPSNVMLGEDGHPRLMDFGLAKRDAGEITMTIDGQILGTPAYMSPEQARGEAHEVDGRSDVYSLGVILYELLAGELPFRGNKRMLLHQVLHDEPRPPRRLNDRIPKDLETICLKAMAKEPGRRYQTARELSEDLRRYLKGEPIKARPVGQGERLWRWCKRNPVVAALEAGIALALLLGTIVAWYFATQASREAALAKSNEQRADREAALAKANEKLAKDEKLLSDRRYYISEMKLASLEAEAGQMGLVQERLREQEPKQPGDPDLRGFEWYYLQRLCQLDLHTFRGKGAYTSVAFSPDGKRLASGSRDHTVKVWDLTTASGGREPPEPLTLKGHADDVRNVAFSPDGKRLASASVDNTVKVWDLAPASGGREPPEPLTLKGHANTVLSVAFSPDGKRLASASYDKTVKVWDAASGKEALTLKGHGQSVRSVAFSPDGKRLASASLDGTVKVWDPASGQNVLTLEGHYFRSIAFSPDGRRLASASYETVKVWDLAKAASAGREPSD